MPKSPAQQTIRLGNPLYSSKPDMDDPAWFAWQWYVDRGAIGTGSGTTPAQRARHIRNERLLCGERVPRIWEE